jgi:hypothetical protein
MLGGREEAVVPQLGEWEIEDSVRMQAVWED